MLTRTVRIQLVIFGVISVVVMAIVGVTYIKLPQLLGWGRIDVKMIVADSSGLYPQANVTYRGDEIGKVDSLDVLPSGDVEVEMRIDDGADIPADLDAEVHSRSAVGEQYVDLLPRTDGKPYLSDGDVIPKERTRIPEQIGPVLEEVNSLVAGLPQDDLRTVIDETAVAFNDIGPDLSRLITSAQALVGEAEDAYPQTHQLLADLEPLLNTQVVTSDKIRSFVGDLALTTDQLRESDADLRRLLPATSPFAEQIVGLFQDLRPTLPILLGNLISVSEVAAIYHAGIEQVLVLLPTLPAIMQSATVEYADITAATLDFKAAVNDPPPCTLGFTPPEQWRLPSETTIPETPGGLFCKIPQNDPSVVRGTRNMPCMEAPGRRADTPEHCRSPEGYQPLGTNPFIDLPGGVPSAPTAWSPGVAEIPYDPVTGRFQAPDGQFYVLGKANTAATWQQLLLPAP